MRGQAHTLEAFTAALLLVSGVLFSLQATAVTPLSASTSNQHIQNQQAAMAADLLAIADNGTLRDAVVFWNATTERFPGTGEVGYYTEGGPPNAFGRLLNDTFREESVAFNVRVHYWEANATATRTMVYMGSPSDNAVTAARTVTLYNSTRLTGPADATLASAAADGTFYAPDVARGSQVFNVVEVEVVVWRM